MENLNGSLTDDAGLDEFRMTLRDHLPAIVAEIEVALNDASLHVPLFVVIPSSGRAVATLGTPGDPDDASWDRIDAIARRIIGEKLGLKDLCCVELANAVANHKMMVVEMVPVRDEIQ